MIIDSITLNNFRIYRGTHKIVFPLSTNKNIFIISGDNGFGKTTFLTSLIWCLYGKLMGDVDDKFKKEISENFGYKNFAKSNLNKALQTLSKESTFTEEEIKNIRKRGYNVYEPNQLEFKERNEYSVNVTFSNVFLPSISCEYVSITRTYDTFLEIESVQILIDGKENELTKEVGSEIFINDFILSREIAKFFFFDSEKIVSLAEMKTLDDKRKLSLAYSEVLGVKKYEDLKYNLENLRIKFRRKSADLIDKDKLNKVIHECDDLVNKIDELKSQQIKYDTEILKLRQASDQLQEMLIREGNKISLKDLQNLKVLRDELKIKDNNLKTRLKELLDLAPFAIAGRSLVFSYQQMISELKDHENNGNSTAISEKLIKIKNAILNQIEEKELSKENNKLIHKIIENEFKKELNFKNSDVPQNKSTVIDFSPSEQNEFKAIYENIKYSYRLVFAQLVKDDRNNKNFLLKTNRKISQAEANDSDTRIKKIRDDKAQVDKTISELEKFNRNISEQIGSYQKELTTKNKLKAELAKKVSVDESDKYKDEIAERLIYELDEFLTRLKSKKKSSLEINIRHELNKLMHKVDFIDKVQVDVTSDIIEIRLFDNRNIEIKKESLSKGEQQLYATAILKALVDESEIKFPIFIDSPLQKFDKKHSNKIITEFYPSVSEQVVIFPLLEKELSLEEYRSMLPYVRSSHIIRNSLNSSCLQEVNPEDLYEKYQQSYVYPHKDIQG